MRCLCLLKPVYRSTLHFYDVLFSHLLLVLEDTTELLKLKLLKLLLEMVFTTTETKKQKGRSVSCACSAS